jgi:hypothetical protein
MLYYNITEVHAWARSQIAVLAALIARVLLRFHPRGRAQCDPKKGAGDPKKGAGNAGCAVHPQPRVQCRKHTGRHYRFTENTRRLLRNGFNGLFHALPGDEFVLSPSPAD